MWHHNVLNDFVLYLIHLDAKLSCMILQKEVYHIAGKFDGQLNLVIRAETAKLNLPILFNQQCVNASISTLGPVPSMRGVHVASIVLARCQLYFL